MFLPQSMQASAVLLLFGFAVAGPGSMPAKKKGGAGGKPSWTPVTAPHHRIPPPSS